MSTEPLRVRPLISPLATSIVAARAAAPVEDDRVLRRDDPHSAVSTREWLARLSINQMTTPRWSLEEDLERYRAAGVPAIGVNWQKLNDDAIPSEVARIRQSGMRVSSVGWCAGFTGGAGQTYRESLLDARRKLRVAGQLSAAALLVIPGPQGSHIRSHASRLTVDAMTELCDAAAGSSVKIALQPMHSLFCRSWSFLHSLDHALDILDRVGSDRAGLSFGTYHLWQEPRLNDRISEIAQRIALVQLSDWRQPPRCENDRLLPGDGCIPLREIVSSLEAAGYQGSYEVEVWSRDLWKQDHVDLMNACVCRFQQLQPSGSPALNRG